MTNSKGWIYLILLSFVGLIMPKEIWHDCDGMHQIVNNQDHKSTHFSKDTSCAVCDFHFFPAVENQILAYAFTKTIHPSLELIVEEFNLVVKENISLRGPPECMFEA